jgi:hypothetical protein
LKKFLSRPQRCKAGPLRTTDRPLAALTVNLDAISMLRNKI